MNRVPRPGGTLAFLAAWLTPWRPAYRVRAAHSRLRFFVHYRDAIGRHIAKYGTHEPLLTRWLDRYLEIARPGIVVDIGANVGWHALHASRHRSVEMVVAFEPDPFNAWLLDRNLSANGIENVILQACACGAMPGSAQLFRYRSSNFGRHSLITNHGSGSRIVPVIDLDGALANLGMTERPVAAVKIDVEGYEPAVIAGAGRTLERTAAVIIEYSPDLNRQGGLSADEMLNRLDTLGFTPFALRASGGTVRVEFGELRDFAGSVDVIFVRGGAEPDLVRALDERARGGVTLLAIAEENKRVVK